MRSFRQKIIFVIAIGGILLKFRAQNFSDVGYVLIL